MLTTLDVLSAGYDDGNTVRFSCNGVPLPYCDLNVGRGFNLVRLDEGFSPIEACVFDTHANDWAADAMKDFVERVPHGMVVLVAVKDSAAAKASPAAYAALRALGAGGDVQLARRDSYALIGRKGAPGGPARELHHRSGQGPAEVRLHFEMKMCCCDITPQAVHGHGVPTKEVGRKFDAEGKVLPFSGFSVVAMVPSEVSCAFEGARKLIKGSIAGQACLSETLPLSSLHMTVCNDGGRLKARWAEVNAALATFAEEVTRSGEQFRAVGVRVDSARGRLNVQLAPAGCAPKEPFDKLRRTLTELSGLTKHDPADKRLHINSWYRLWEAAPQYEHLVVASVADGVRSLERTLEKMNYEVPLVLPHLTHFPDMAHFPDNCRSDTIMLD